MRTGQIHCLVLEQIWYIGFISWAENKWRWVFKDILDFITVWWFRADGHGFWTNWGCFFLNWNSFFIRAWTWAWFLLRFEDRPQHIRRYRWSSVQCPAALYVLHRDATVMPSLNTEWDSLCSGYNDYIHLVTNRIGALLECMEATMCSTLSGVWSKSISLPYDKYETYLATACMQHFTCFVVVSLTNNIKLSVFFNGSRG